MEGRLAYIWYWMGCLNSTIHCGLFYPPLTGPYSEPDGDGAHVLYYRLSGYYPAILFYQVNQYQEFSIM